MFSWRESVRILIPGQVPEFSLSGKKSLFLASVFYSEACGDKYVMAIVHCALCSDMCAVQCVQYVVCGVYSVSMLGGLPSWSGIVIVISSDGIFVYIG